MVGCGVMSRQPTQAAAGSVCLSECVCVCRNVEGKGADGGGRGPEWEVSCTA